MAATQQQRRSLFGGALRCAGLAAAATITTAASAEFVPLTSYSSTVHMFGWDGSYTPVFDVGAGLNAFPASLNYAGPGLSMSAYASSSVIGAYIHVTDAPAWSFTYLLLNQYFTVANSKEALLEWDLVGWDSYVNSAVRVYEAGVGFIAQYDTTDAPGSLLLSLTAGNLYAIQIGVIGVHGDGDDGYCFARLTNVPAPSALALLGVGMLGTRRRRRT